MTKMRLLALLFAVFVPVVISAQSRVSEILNWQRLELKNDDCLPNDTCSLKELVYLKQNYRIWIEDGYHYGTRFFALYRTESLETLEDYVFVNFIKGCKYSSWLENGRVVGLMDKTIKYKDSVRPFLFPEWTVDSDLDDPVYPVVQGYPRHAGYRWNKVFGSFDATTEFFYKDKEPDRPILYIRDLPGTAFFMNNSAQNTSLKFRTCVYKNSEVPFIVEPTDTEFANPIHCFEWESSWVYNHDAGKFQHSYDLSPVCRNN